MAIPDSALVNPTDLWARCSNATLRTDIAKKGSVTLCDVETLTPTTIDAAYVTDGAPHVMDALLAIDIEIGLCGTKRQGWYDLFMSRRVNMQGKIEPDGKSLGLYKVKPFINARRYTPINNQRWVAYNGQALSGGTYQYDLVSPEGIPNDEAWFNASQRVYMSAVVDGFVSDTYWKVVSATVTTATIGADAGTSCIRVVLTPLNSGTLGIAAKAEPKVQASGTDHSANAIVYRGSVDAAPPESNCAEPPALRNDGMAAFWWGWMRLTMQTDTQYEEFRKLMTDRNLYYERFMDLDSAQRMKQQLADFQTEIANDLMFSKPIANQTVENYTSLATISFSDPDNLVIFGEDRCEMRKANIVGVKEQLKECTRVSDAQGAALNIPAFIDALVAMMRVRESRQYESAHIFDVWMPESLAELFNDAMLTYYKAKGQDMVRLNASIGDAAGAQQQKKAPFGFWYRKYEVFRYGITINVLTSYALDDLLTDATAAGIEAIGVSVLVLDFSDISVGIGFSSEKVAESGTWEQVAKISQQVRCQTDLPQITTRHREIMALAKVECPSAHLIIENLDLVAPDTDVDGAVAYPNDDDVA